MLSQALRGHVSAMGTGRLWVAALVLLCLGSVRSSADTPFVVDEWRFGVHETTSTLRYCGGGRLAAARGGAPDRE